MCINQLSIETPVVFPLFKVHLKPYLHCLSVGEISIKSLSLVVIDYYTVEFALICITTGGPATIVTWTRNSTTLTEGTRTVLENTTIARYVHTVSVTGRLGGNYTCNVSNNKPSSNYSTIILKGKKYT